MAVGGTYNITNTKVFNLASGGATIDSKLVTPYEPTVLYAVFTAYDEITALTFFRSSIVDQVSQFNEFLAPRPAGAQWSSDDSLFAIWIGINDVVR